MRLFYLFLPWLIFSTSLFDNFTVECKYALIQNKNYKKDSMIILPYKFKSFNVEVDVEFRDTIDSLGNCQKNSFQKLDQKLDTLFEEELMEKIFNFYKESYKFYLGDSDSSEVEDIIPKPTNPIALKKHIQPLSIYVPKEQNCSEGYFGIYFDCTWDINNSLGVIIKNWKVFRVGNGDIAFMH